MKDQKGSVTVEASIALVTFTFVMISLLTLINIARAQMLIQDALNKSCLEISEYMYLSGIIAGIAAFVAVIMIVVIQRRRKVK